MPVPCICRNGKNIPGGNRSPLPFDCDNALSFDDVQNLITIVHVGMGPRTCAEPNCEQFHVFALL